MKYFLDTEFVEGMQQRTFLGVKIGETKPTIDLISIGIVAEDGREYYAISKDFNLKEAWNRYQLEQCSGDMKNLFPEGRKVYWLRNNVLKPIFYELSGKDIAFHDLNTSFTFDNFERLILRYGKTNKEIAEEVKDFCITYDTKKSVQDNNPKFYADYCSYDWVVFCWLFGKMINLPHGFPMYCNDIQQLLEQKSKAVIDLNPLKYNFVKNQKDALIVKAFSDYKKCIKMHPDYPKQEESKKHHALEDARYDRDLYNFLNAL